MSNPNQENLTTLQIARLALYSLAVLAGLAGVIADAAGYTDLAGLVTSLATTLLVITGGTAALNLNKGKETIRPIEVLDAIGDVAAAAKRPQVVAQDTTPVKDSYITLDDLRKRM